MSLHLETKSLSIKIQCFKDIVVSLQTNNADILDVNLKDPMITEEPVELKLEPPGLELKSQPQQELSPPPQNQSLLQKLQNSRKQKQKSEVMFEQITAFSITCPYCHQIITDERMFKKHHEEHHTIGGKKWRCCQCNYVSLDINQYITHINTHEPDPDRKKQMYAWICMVHTNGNICGERKSTKYYMQKHHHTKHGIQSKIN